MRHQHAVDTVCRFNFLIRHFGRFDTKMESLACDAGINAALDWDGEDLDGLLEVIGIATGWDGAQLAAFKLGFDETRKFQDRVPEFDGERRPPILGGREWRKSRKKFLTR